MDDNHNNNYYYYNNNNKEESVIIGNGDYAGGNNNKSYCYDNNDDTDTRATSHCTNGSTTTTTTTNTYYASTSASAQQQQQQQKQFIDIEEDNNNNSNDKGSGTGSNGKNKNNNNKNNDDENSNSSNKTVTSSSVSGTANTAAIFDLQRARCTAIVILLLAILGCIAFIVRGVKKANEKSYETFVRRAMELTQTIELTWRSYETMTLELHNICRQSRNTTREEFHDFYLYWSATGLQFDSCQCSPNITHAERPKYEAEAKAYYAEHYPTIDYKGIIGFVPVTTYDESTGTNITSLEAMVSPVKPFYWTVHYLEPVLPNAPAIELDMYSFPSQKNEIDLAVSTRQPVLSKRLNLIQETEGDKIYSIIIYHPGIQLHDDELWVNDDYPTVLSLIVVRMPALFERVARAQKDNLAVYLYDTTILNTGGIPEFVVAGAFTGENKVNFLDEIDYDTFRKQHKESSHRRNELYYEERVSITPSGTWRIAVVPIDDTYDANITYVLLAGFFIAGSGLIFSIWFVTSVQRNIRLNEIKLANEAERHALIAENAKQAVETERELNDFLAHEVRNPLSAAISACSFVESAVNKEKITNKSSSANNNNSSSSSSTEPTIEEDLAVIRSSLQYVNDLLRDMLDMHKASSGQMRVDFKPTHLLHDIFEPVATMLYKREYNFIVEIDCSEQLTVLTDRIRLKQVVLNLANNSCKFVTKGFVRIGAFVDNVNHVTVFVADSGPGVPIEKRKHLFEKFQGSLDILSQGTGVGLKLCKDLASALQGDIDLDAHYASGIDDMPGSRFLVNLKKSPLDVAENFAAKESYSNNCTGNNLKSSTRSSSSTTDALFNIPDNIKVLFVDDDLILRKMFTRSVQRVAPTWEIQQACNGETAVRYVQEDKQVFDIIFMDQHMASVQKQLLGTETVRKLRSLGYEGIICGLSANNMQKQFMEAGANAFMLKPFPCEKEELKQELYRVLFSEFDV